MELNMTLLGEKDSAHGLTGAVCLPPTQDFEHNQQNLQGYWEAAFPGSVWKVSGSL